MYVGRFAPSPTGLLHAGSLVAALASWLDARAHGGRWLLRIEDVDTPRCQPGASDAIVQQLATCGLLPDEPPWHQSTRSAAYQQALTQLSHNALAYPCACSRSDIASWHQAQGQQRPRGTEWPYPGLCRPETGGLHGRPPRAWRLHTLKAEQTWPASQNSADSSPHRTPNGPLHWHDRRLGWQRQHVSQHVGDFVLRRADGLWAYQLAVVVDDAAQGITHIVRGADLADNTARQILLQHALGLPHPHYAHTPLVLAADGEKLSKQNGAQPLLLDTPAHVLQALNHAAAALGLPPAPAGSTPADALAGWTRGWQLPQRHPTGLNIGKP